MFEFGEAQFTGFFSWIMLLEEIFPQPKVTKIFYYFFFQKSYIFRFYIQVYDPFWFNFCTCWEKLIKILLCFCILISTSICWKDNQFSPKLSWELCQKSVFHICMSLFLDSPFCPLINSSVLMPVSHCLDDCWFNKTSSQVVFPLQLCFLFSKVFGLFYFCAFQYEFHKDTVRFYKKKKTTRILISITLNR